MTTIESATSTLLGNYDRILDGRTGLMGVFGGDNIRQADLERIANDPSAPQELREAARFLLDSDVSRNFLDVGAGKGSVDGRISREDLEAALETIGSGAYYDELLDTAAGKGGSWNPFVQGARDGEIGPSDIEAALNDPGVPLEVKDTLRLLQSTEAGRPVGEVLAGMDGDDFAALSALASSPEFRSLPTSDQALVVEALRNAGGDDAVARDIATLLADPSFQAMTAAQQTAKLTEVAIQQSPEFTALPASDQKLVLDALAGRAPGDTGLPATVASLLASDDFQDLSAAEKTAVLSQAANYPDSRSVENIERLLAKDWFQDFDLADKQRTLKAVAYMSQNDAGDATINANTLDHVLSPDSDIVFAWDSSYNGDINSNGGLYGTAGGGTITFNSNMVNAGNGPLTETYNSKHVVLHTIAHEVNHILSGDRVADSYEYLEQEYRAWYTGFKAEFGREPTNAEAMGRWRNQIDGSASYSTRSWAAINSSPEEALKFAEQLSLMTGVPVPQNASHDELKQYIQDQVDLPSSKYADAGGAAPVPPGNITNE
ncbi:hypothetical protein [Luteimonas arsenica]|uniref:hypothetical protein n=1 Tax=Luteimonas arsenica TaxID=1586242 RepID=UPI001054F14C|nr:hypothetical protein [Luteimonas arsenica]